MWVCRIDLHVFYITTLGPVERCGESRNPTVPITEQSYRYVHQWIVHSYGIIMYFLFKSALVELVRPMKVDQLCVMVKLVKESISTSVTQEAGHNQNWPPHWMLSSQLYLLQLPVDAKTWSDMYCASTTTHLVATMEPSQLQFLYVLRNAFMFKMNVLINGTSLNVYSVFLDLILVSSTAAVQDRY